MKSIKDLVQKKSFLTTLGALISMALAHYFGADHTLVAFAGAAWGMLTLAIAKADEGKEAAKINFEAQKLALETEVVRASMRPPPAA